MNLPSTIKFPDTFNRSPSAGFDGVFDWSWTQGCFGETKIKPMDFDGVVERNGNFILFETKQPGVPIPQGQRITLVQAHSLGCFTVMVIYGKEKPEKFEMWYPGAKNTHDGHGLEAARERVSSWYAWANKNPRKTVDVSILNKRITQLIDESEFLKFRISEAKSLIDQAVNLLTLSAPLPVAPVDDCPF